MPTTYTPLATSTISGSSTNSVAFSSIPATYTDLILIINGANTSGGWNTVVRYNGDSGTNYSFQRMLGNGSAVSSGRQNNQTGYDWAGYLGTTRGTVITQIQNYANTTTLKSAISRSNSTEFETNLSTGLWRSTAAINQVSVTTAGGNFADGTTLSLYGVASAAVVSGAKATGGDVVATDGTYWYHAFLASGTFTPSQALSCDVLTIAGGGGGGGGVGGGGGAGGYQLFSSQSISATAQTVTVGGGGTGGSGAGGVGRTNGSNTQFASLTASVGGGFGATLNGGAAAANGGSGGGGAGALSIGTGTAGQGNNGGGGGVNGAGGGGGSGAVGGTATNTNGAAGGAGKNSESSWLSVTGLGVNGFIAGGGGGGGNAGGTGGAAGSGGASAGTQTGNASNATANTGSGGGGGAYNSSAFNGGNGGSGLVIVRYAV